MGENKFRTHDIVSEEKNPMSTVDIHQRRFLKGGERTKAKQTKSHTKNCF